MNRPPSGLDRHARRRPRLGRERRLNDASTAVSKGLGFRYLVARKLELYAGIDYAKSNYDQAVYLTIGSACR